MNWKPLSLPIFKLQNERFFGIIELSISENTFWEFDFKQLKPTIEINEEI